MQYARPNLDISTGEWSPTPLFSYINEVIPDTGDTYVYSPNNPTGNTFEVKLNNILNPSGKLNHNIKYYYGKNVDGTQDIDLTVSLYQGSTLIKETGLYNIGSGLISGQLNLTSTEANNIVDYSDLRIRFFAQNSIYRNLLHYFPLNELNGLRYDVWKYSGTYNLEDFNTIGSIDGKVNKAAKIESGNNESFYFDFGPNNIITFNDNWEISIWVSPHLPNNAVSEIFFGTPFPTQNFDFYIENAMFNIDYYSGTNHIINFTDTPIVSGQWYFVTFGQNYSNNKPFLTVNNQFKEYPTPLPFPNYTIGTGTIGGWGTLYPFNGYLDEIGMWQRNLTSGERSMLYNNGNGLSWPLIKPRLE